MKKSALISDEKYKSFIENVGVGIITFDRNGTHLNINPAFSGMTGFEKEEVIGTNFPALYWPEHFTQELEDEIERLMKNGFLKTESFFRRKNETIFPVSLIGGFIQSKNGIPVEFIILVQDISDIKQAERKLKLTQEMLIAVNKKLEIKVEERTAEVKKLLKQKDGFINQLAHDLKNSLTPMVNFLPMITEEINLDPKIKEALEIILRNVDYLENLVFCMLRLAKINSPFVELDLKKINLLEIVDNVIKNNAHVYKGKGIQVENLVDSSFFVNVDQLLLQEVLNNLSSNAVKFTKPGGRLIIDAKKNEEEKFITVSVKDTGKGMTKDQFERIFDEFYKAEESQNDMCSSGLGLSICKSIIEKHSGKIWAESPGYGKGSTMFFNLPIDYRESCSKIK